MMLDGLCVPEKMKLMSLGEAAGADDDHVARSGRNGEVSVSHVQPASWASFMPPLKIERRFFLSSTTVVMRKRCLG